MTIVTGYLQGFGYNFAKNYTSYSTGTQADWGNPQNITGSPNFSYSTAVPLSSTTFSEIIKARDFDFQIPPIGSTGDIGVIQSITLSGISVALYSYGWSGAAPISPGWIIDGEAYFVGTGETAFDPGAIFTLSQNLIGKNGSPPRVWPTTSGGLRDFQYAGIDLLGIGLNADRDILNHRNFGFAIKVTGSGSNTTNTAYIDAVSAHVLMYIVESGDTPPISPSGYFNDSGNRPTLFIRGFDYFSGSIPLFLKADENCARTYGPKYGTGIYTTCGGGEFSWVTPSAVMVSDNIRATSDITTPNGNTCRLDVLNFRFDEVPDNFQVDGVKFSVEKKQNVGDLSILDKEIYLVKSGELQLYENKANGILWPESEATPVEYGGDSDRWGVPFLSAADIRASGFGISLKAWASGAVGTAYIDSISCTIYGTVPCEHSGIPFYIRGFGPSGSIPLYLYSAEPNSGNITLFINTVYSGSIPLYLQGNTTNSGSIPLYLANHIESGSLPLYTKGIFGSNRGATLFLKVNDWLTKSSGLSLTIPYSQTGNYTTNFTPLFIQAKNHPQDMPLYIQVGNSANVSGISTLYIQGGRYSTSFVIPLFLSNSGMNEDLPLFIEGQKITPYNPFFPSDGFYNWSGGVSLFIQRPIQEGLGLFIGSYLASGNMPLYLQGTYGSDSGIPLFMATQASGTSSIILYANGY